MHTYDVRQHSYLTNGVMSVRVILTLRNGREGIRKFIEQQNQERNLQTEKAYPADLPKKVLKVKSLFRAKAEFPHPLFLEGIYYKF